ncbi:ATP-dependent endonuclease [Dyadobacter sp. CY356]|uniref:ATP-dependent nuclease n=1 Tax=Dyadobacter sp. CY356 TaxID=2906442 RepID=UPI001F252A69|nr:AAA family ATPase [Dyadobacter sp. CY356]MCF0055387.1 AAA family ATPase [Dyadobacter sp. CY356]
MPRLKQIIIEGFRSISDQVVINFPENKPVVLIGENNSGKSNIIRAIELMFGEFHPKYKKLEDYDHYKRDTSNQVIIEATVTGFNARLGRASEFSCGGFKFQAQKGKENNFYAIQAEDGRENMYVSTNLREELLCIVVNSEQNLNFQLSYSSKYTLLSKVTKAFHDKLTDDKDRVEKLKGFFESIKTTFMEVKEFNVFSENMSSIANTVLSNMTHALAFDFSAYDPSNYFKTLRVHPTEDGETRAYEELGTGQQQILALSFAHAYAKSFLGQGLLFILDEPEAHLHPLAQKWLAKKMFKMAEDGLQIILTTHSPYFVDLNYIEGINLIRKDSETTLNINQNATTLYNHCLKTASNPHKTKEETIVPFYANNSTSHILSGFFANKIVLVEGPTEELALPIYFEKLGFDPTEFGIEIIGVGGKGNLAKWWRLFTLYQIPTFICFDNDYKKDDEKGFKRKDALKAIGIKDEELDGILGNDTWAISDSFCVFGTDFETTMRASFADYADIEKQTIETLGSSSKNLIARETAKLINLHDDSEGKTQMTGLIGRIKKLTL